MKNSFLCDVFFRAGCKAVSFGGLVRDRLVLVALAGGAVTPECLRNSGARDVLVLDRMKCDATTGRLAEYVYRRYTRIPDVRKNNCNVAILYGTSAFALGQKREFANFTYVLLPLTFSIAVMALFFGLIRYGRRRVLSFVGVTEVLCDGRWRCFFVLKSHANLCENCRLYGATGLSPLELIRLLDGLNYVVLRWSEQIITGTHIGDIDLLVAYESLSELRMRYSQRIGTYPIDVYTDGGQDGHTYKKVPYFIPKLAREILDSASVGEKGVRVPSSKWRFISFCYHLLFHDKFKIQQVDLPELKAENFKTPQYLKELIRLAACAGYRAPSTVDDMDRLLTEAGVFPGCDLIGFYSHKYPFLKNRYLDFESISPGLVTFFVRDFGAGNEYVPEVRVRLLQNFEILDEGPIDVTNRASVLSGVRGGNWVDKAAVNGLAEPIYWFVCRDPFPVKPSRRIRRKHPLMDNERIRIKDSIRKDIVGDGKKGLRLVHSSDNSLEAMEHIRHLNLSNPSMSLSNFLFTSNSKKKGSLF